MPGFLVSNGTMESPLIDRYPDRCLAEALCIAPLGGGVNVRRNTLNKFLQDKAFEDNDELFLVLEGCLLNKQSLYKKYHVSSVPELVRSMLPLCGETFFREFRGCFSGAVYEKKTRKWIVFTNQIGDNPIFYVCEKGTFAAGSQVNYILDFCREHGIGLSFDESCAYQMLTYGFIATDETYANEIKRLHGGDYLVFQDGTLTVKQYHRFEKHTDRFKGRTEEQIIDEIDQGFRAAVALEWQKDEEYGLEHLTDLSGGLDSRMNMWAAHEMRERHMTALTYCKGGYLDETIAEEIAAYWNDELLFKPLDDASFLYDIDENTFMLGGLSLYSACTGAKQMLSSLNMSRFGIEHTGMVGDVVLGSYYRSANDGNQKQPTGMYSERMKEKLPKYVIDFENNYYDHEIFLLYTRGFHGMCNSHLIRKNFTEVSAPFLNVEFFQLCFDIPVEMRIGHNIYKKWILSKYPQAARYKWEKTGGRITESRYRAFARKLVKKGPQKLLRMLGKASKISDGMNPIDYWIANNDAVRHFLDDYEQNGYAWLPKCASEQLVQDMKRLYKTGNASEKAMVLTVLASAKLYFSTGG